MDSSRVPKRKAPCRTVWLRLRRAKTYNYHGWTVAKRGPPCQQGDNLEVAKDTMPVIELAEFPEDILHHIHSLLPLRDAARAACVSRRFLSSWRCFPNLTFNWKTIGFNQLDEDTYETEKKFKEYMDRIYHIFENHSGTGVKTLELNLCPWGNDFTASHLDIWLQTAVKSGILELVVDLPHDHSPKYNFPCLLLSCAASSIRSLSLASCAFRPTLMIGCLRNLKSLYLRLVTITEEELGSFFSCTISLEEFEICDCNEITSLKIPSYLQRLRILVVRRCERLEAIEIYAPKVTSFVFIGPPTKISIADSSQLETVVMNGSTYSGMFRYALTKLYSFASDLHTLVLHSYGEAINSTPGSAHKFLQLRHLKIYFHGRKFHSSFDFLSMVSFLEACPVLETFFLSAAGQRFRSRQEPTLKDSDADSWHIKQIPGFRHDKLKKVSITGVQSTKSLIELACQILESCSSLRCLVLDTTSGYDDRSMCENLGREDVMEALKGFKAIKRHLKGKVPSSVELTVLKPCDRCHMPTL